MLHGTSSNWGTPSAGPCRPHAQNWKCTGHCSYSLQNLKNFKVCLKNTFFGRAENSFQREGVCILSLPPAALKWEVTWPCCPWLEPLRLCCLWWTSGWREVRSRGIPEDAALGNYKVCLSNIILQGDVHCFSVYGELRHWEVELKKPMIGLQSPRGHFAHSVLFQAYPVPTGHLMGTCSQVQGYLSKTEQCHSNVHKMRATPPPPTGWVESITSA